MKKAKTVYVAGPYTRGDVDTNVRTAMDIATELTRKGFVPFVPHLYHYWDKVHPNGYEHWMWLCLSWVERCDCLLRFSGESPGADREVQHAKENGLRVYHSLEELVSNEQI